MFWKLTSVLGLTRDSPHLFQIVAYIIESFLLYTGINCNVLLRHQNVRRIWGTCFFPFCLLNWLQLFKSDIIKMLIKRNVLPGMTFVQVHNKRLFDNPASVWNKGKIKSDLYDQTR